MTPGMVERRKADGGDNDNGGGSELDGHHHHQQQQQLNDKTQPQHLSSSSSLSTPQSSKIMSSQKLNGNDYRRQRVVDTSQSLKRNDSDGSTPESSIPSPHDDDDNDYHGEKKDDDDHSHNARNNYYPQHVRSSSATSSTKDTLPIEEAIPPDESRPQSQQPESHQRARLLRRRLPGRHQQETNTTTSSSSGGSTAGGVIPPEQSPRAARHSNASRSNRDDSERSYTNSSDGQSFAGSGSDSGHDSSAQRVHEFDSSQQIITSLSSSSSQQHLQPQQFDSPDVVRKGKVRNKAIRGWYTDTDGDGNHLQSPTVFVKQNSDRTEKSTSSNSISKNHHQDQQQQQSQQKSDNDNQTGGYTRGLGGTGGGGGDGEGDNSSNSDRYQQQDHSGGGDSTESNAVNDNDGNDDHHDNDDHHRKRLDDPDYTDHSVNNGDGLHQSEGSMLWRARLLVGRTVNHEYVQITIIILIVLNAIMMGLATMDWVTENPTVENVFTKIDRGFLVIFTLEVAMQLFYLGLTLFQDAWLIFDLIIVILSWSFESLQIVRAFRIFRAFRLVTRVKPLRDLVLAVGAVLPRMYAIAALLLIIFYVFAVLFTELFSDLVYEDDINYFKTLDASLFTCMEMMTLEWAGIARETIDQVSWAWAPFTAFIAISGFIVYNLIVAVVVEAVAVTEQQVRVMDGIQSDSPTAQLEEAQERVDLIRCHLEDMLRTQNQVQEMIEQMASELLHLETERMKAEHRETILRNEMNRRAEYQRSMESSRQIAPLERNFLTERERRDSQRRSRTLQSQGSIGDMGRSDSAKSLQGNQMEGLNHTVHGDGIDRTMMSPGRSRMRRRGSASGSTPNGRRGGSNRSLMSRSASSRSGSSTGSDGASWRGLLAIHSSDKMQH